MRVDQREVALKCLLIEEVSILLDNSFAKKPQDCAIHACSGLVAGVNGRLDTRGGVVVGLVHPYHVGLVPVPLHNLHNVRKNWHITH